MKDRTIFTAFHRLASVFFLLGLAAGGAGWAATDQLQSGEQVTVTALDPSFSQIVAPDAAFERIHYDPTGFFEGPNWIGGKNGYLIFSDIPGNQILRVSASGIIEAVVANIQKGTKGAIFDKDKQRYLVGPNGVTAAPDGSFVYCVFVSGGRIERFDPQTKARSIIASDISGAPINLPNDLAFSARGELFFTAQGGIYRVRSTAELWAKVERTNGLAFSLDGRFLYTTEGPSQIVKFPVGSDGKAGEKQTFFTTLGSLTHGPLDGLKVDVHGNVWAVAVEGIWVISPSGKHIGTIRAPVDRFTNLTFGGPHGDTLYTSAPEGVYQMRLKPRDVH